MLLLAFIGWALWLDYNSQDTLWKGEEIQAGEVMMDHGRCSLAFLDKMQQGLHDSS